jgi:fucose permease
MAGDPTSSPETVEARRISRQRKIVIGLVVTFLGLLVFVAAPDLTGPLVADLPYFAIALVSLYAGGILLGVGLGQRQRAR